MDRPKPIYPSSLTTSSNVGHKTKQEAHGPRLAHLSEIATADMQMLCKFFPILSLQLMKGPSFKQFLVLKKKNVFYCFFTIYGHDSQWKSIKFQQKDQHEIW